MEFFHNGHHNLLSVRCPDIRGLNVCTLIQMGPWTSVLIINEYTSLPGFTVVRTYLFEKLLLGPDQPKFHFKQEKNK